MDLFNRMSSKLKQGAQAVGDGASSVLRTTGEAVASDTTQRVVGVAVDGLSDVVFGSAEKVVERVGQVAEITQSQTLQSAHAIADTAVGVTKHFTTTGAKALLGGIANVSGKKLAAISGPKKPKEE
jgi:hypothetical protein